MAFNIAKSTRVVTYDTQCTTENQEETLYTCPDNARAMMSLLFVSNVSGNTTVDVEWYRGDGARHNHILGGKNMTTGEYIQFDGAYIVFEPGDYMTITPSSNTSPHVDAFVTVEEIFVPVGS